MLKPGDYIKVEMDYSFCGSIFAYGLVLLVEDSYYKPIDYCIHYFDPFHPSGYQKHHMSKKFIEEHVTIIA